MPGQSPVRQGIVRCQLAGFFESCDGIIDHITHGIATAQVAIGVRVFFVNMRSFMLEPENDTRLVKVNLTIAQEDIDLLETLDPVGPPAPAPATVLVPSDGAVVSYRKFLNQWKDRGWRIDMEMQRATRQNRAYAIPCPDRRTSGNWVLNSIPLRSPDKKKSKAA